MITSPAHTASLPQRWNRAAKTYPESRIRTELCHDVRSREQRKPISEYLVSIFLHPIFIRRLFYTHAGEPRYVCRTSHIIVRSLTPYCETQQICVLTSYTQNVQELNRQGMVIY